MALTRKRQHRINQANADVFRQTLIRLKNNPFGLASHPRLLQAKIKDTENILAELEAEIAEYEKQVGK
jgi:hypothetical protein